MSALECTGSISPPPSLPIERMSQPGSQESVASVAGDHLADLQPADAPPMPPVTSYTRSDSTAAVRGSQDSENLNSQPIQPSYDGTETSQNE